MARVPPAGPALTPTVLVVAPMPAAPASAGNRRRLALTCAALKRAGFAIDFAYFAHEDQIYRRFGQHPPTDLAEMSAAFQRTFLIEADVTIPLKTRSPSFGIDEWGSVALDQFVAWYAEQHPETVAILVNYVFLSRCLDHAPTGMLKLIDTHDRFADRQLQYKPFRAEPNFFYTDRQSEALALGRADVVLAIQSEEAAYFASLTDRCVLLLPPAFPVRAPFAAPQRITRIGFVGHGNDPNLFSIAKFAHEWAVDWTPDRPELRIAGEICNALGTLELPGVRLLGYVDDLSNFYAGTDVIVAPMLLGSGLKMKVAEAFSHGVPVVGTEIGFEGFGAEAPAHRCEGVRAVKATILALKDNAAGLADLTDACTTLFARFNAAAERSEAALANLVRDGVGITPRVFTDGGDAGASRKGTAAQTSRGGPEIVIATSNPMTAPWPICVRSINSVASNDPDLGPLLATERLSADAARAIRYAPDRRRWFAGGMAAPAAPSSLGGVRVALSPEWVREKRLPSEVREAAALAFRDTMPDWATQARCVGASANDFALTLALPSHLLKAPRAMAAFLIEEGGRRARELILGRIAPLSLSPGFSFDAERLDLTPVPAAVNFVGVGTIPAVVAGTLLFLTDDLIGRITIAAAYSGEEIRL